MSLRAIKKRENCLSPNGGNGSNHQLRKSLFRKQTNATTTPSISVTTVSTNNPNKLSSNRTTKQYIQNDLLNQIKQQQLLLGRKAYSNPELNSNDYKFRKVYNSSLVRTKSDGDINSLLSNYNKNNINLQRSNLINAKSEVCLQTITSHDYVTEHPLNAKSFPVKKSNKMYKTNSGHHHHQTAYCSSQSLGSPSHRRLSECSSDGYSQRTSSISASELTLSSHLQSNNEPNSVLRVPIIGYEVMEERARFTVYKLRVENPVTNDCWLVLRRYTDFVRLNTKLKQIFPYINLSLPRKKIFGDNFNSVFLDNRVQGLQMFVNSVMAKEDLRKCELVREFFCLDEPPSYSESMEECRAIFEAQEETISHLKLQIQNKNDLILNLQQKLREEMLEKEKLKEALMNLSIKSNPSNYHQ